MNKEQETLFVGFDLCKDASQITCFNKVTFEPESICQTQDLDKYLIPTVLYCKQSTNEWYFAQAAIEKAEEEQGELVSDFLEDPDLLEIFLRKSFTLLKRSYPNDNIAFVVITLNEQKIEVMKGITQSLSRLGIEQDRFAIQSHEQSYFYYALSQKKELWMNDVGLFDLDESGLKYFQIVIHRKHTPMIAKIVKKDYSDTFSYELITSNIEIESLESLMDNICTTALYKQIVSTIYVTGKGFEDNWADKVFAKLCVGRRVFKGQNLYAKGACYAAKERINPSKLDQFLFLSEEMISKNIVLKVYKDAQIREFPIVELGNPWFEYNKNVDIILDGETEIEFGICDTEKRESVSQIVALEGLPHRENKMTRVEIRARFLDPNNCAITVKDKGFGEFYPATDRIWETIIKL